MNERHWQKLIKSINTEVKINVKNITLEDIYSLKLPDHPEIVADICQEASNEFKNDMEIQQIE